MTSSNWVRWFVLGSFTSGALLACADPQDLGPTFDAGLGGQAGFGAGSGDAASDGELEGGGGAAGAGGTAGDASVDASQDGGGGVSGDAAADAPADVTVFPDAPTDVVNIPGLRAYWPFDETGGLVFDVAGNNNHGNVLGQAVNRGVPGKVGKAISFSGLDGRVVVPKSTSLDFSTAATIGFWIRLNSVVPGTILSRGTGTGDAHVRIKTAQGNIQVAFSTGATTASVTSDANQIDTKFRHVAVVNDGVSLKLYLDGNLHKSGTGGGMVGLFSDLYIGKSQATDTAFNGAIDDLKWWNVARTDQEVCSDAGGTWTAVDGGNTCVVP